MIIRIPRDNVFGASLSIDQLACNVSRNTYGGNVTVEVEHTRATSRSDSYRVKLGAGTGGAGSRRSASGRRGPWACWHAFRDVLIAVFDEYPDATAQTAFVTYRGRADFLRNYGATAWHNAGSQMYPQSFAALCDCNDSEV